MAAMAAFLAPPPTARPRSDLSRRMPSSVQVARIGSAEFPICASARLLLGLISARRPGSLPGLVSRCILSIDFLACRSTKPRRGWALGNFKELCTVVR
mmetsp:Transcript_315/g.408  ORF Transcript_315/g.408 Transcript_315/m.408 type:complete len:98 (+) Transcript_315:70-363(+)